MKSLTNYIVESKQTKLDSDGKEHGFEYVDLGLSSGTMWATCNVGADKPEDEGLLFQFGRTDGYKYGDRNNKFYKLDKPENETEFETEEYINPTTSGKTYENDDILSLEDDAAHVNMGGKWRMPTKDDLQELYECTKQKVVTINGKEGMLFTSEINGKSIFIVFVGYWNFDFNQFYNSGSDGSFAWIFSSEVSPVDAENAWQLYCASDCSCDLYECARADALSVRGVFKK